MAAVRTGHPGRAQLPDGRRAGQSGCFPDRPSRGVRMAGGRYRHGDRGRRGRDGNAASAGRLGARYPVLSPGDPGGLPCRDGAVGHDRSLVSRRLADPPASTFRPAARAPCSRPCWRPSAARPPAMTATWRAWEATDRSTTCRKRGGNRWFRRQSMRAADFLPTSCAVPDRPLFIFLLTFHRRLCWR